MGILGEIVRKPDEIYPLLKLKMAVKKAKKQVPPEPHWGFCYSTLHKVSKSFSLVIQQLGTELRNAVCVFYLILRALDTIGGTNEYRVLMDQFRHVSAAFLELEKGCNPLPHPPRMKCPNENYCSIHFVETVDDYDEYCHYAAGLVGLGLSKLFLISQLEVMTPDWEQLSNSMGLFLQKTNIIRDYIEDINEIPKPRMFWPCEIWGKYVDKLEDLKSEENSSKAVQCLNDMVTNALVHIEDCMKYMDALRDPAIFRLCAIPQVREINITCLTAKIVNHGKTMADVYGAFYDFSCMLKAKVDKNCPNSSSTLTRLEAVQKVCRDSGVLHKRYLLVYYIIYDCDAGAHIGHNTLCVSQRHPSDNIANVSSSAMEIGVCW
ncbi:hypothetical protein YC2023_039217 [Brassica napus]